MVKMVSFMLYIVYIFLTPPPTHTVKAVGRRG